MTENEAWAQGLHLTDSAFTLTLNDVKNLKEKAKAYRQQGRRAYIIRTPKSPWVQLFTN